MLFPFLPHSQDLILCQDPLVDKAFIEYEGGDETQLLGIGFMVLPM